MLIPLQDYKDKNNHLIPGADCNLGPTREQNRCAQRKKFFCSRVSLKCSLVEVIWGQLGMFQGPYAVQVAPQTAPYGLLLQTE